MLHISQLDNISFKSWQFCDNAAICTSLRPCLALLNLLFKREITLHASVTLKLKTITPPDATWLQSAAVPVAMLQSCRLTSRESSPFCTHSVFTVIVIDIVTMPYH